MANEPQVNEALALTNQLINLTTQAERQLSSARNWGFIDVLGGGLITDIIKHSKLSNAKSTMDEVNYLMQRLQQTLGRINFPADYRMNVGGFATFADFFFDCGIVDALMLSKIWTSLNEVQKLKNKLYDLRGRLERL